MAYGSRRKSVLPATRPMGGQVEGAATEVPPAGPVARTVDDDRVRRAATAVAGVLAFYFVIQWFWPSPMGVLVQGLVIGGLTAMIAFGIALTYRANRIVNFAAGDLGALPASLAVLLIVSNLSLPYFVAVPIGLVAAIALGALVDFLLIRRFFKAPRL